MAQHLQGKQLQVYTIVQDRLQADSPPPLRMIVSGQCLCTFMLLVSLLLTGTARTGKSYLINCLRLLLGDILRVAAPTGVAAFIISGHTLHSLLSLPTKGEFKDLEGERLHNLQQSLADVHCLIIDEMSMSQLDSHLRQVFPRHADQWPLLPAIW